MILEFQSRLHIGSIRERQIEFPRKMSREYVWYGYAPDNIVGGVRFVGERTGLNLTRIFSAFGIPDIHRLLRRAKFNSQVVVGYTSLNESNVYFEIIDIISLI